jgi:hypothetical protein
LDSSDGRLRTNDLWFLVIHVATSFRFRFAQLRYRGLGS